MQTCFKEAGGKVKKLVHAKVVHHYLTNRQVSWGYIVENVPWYRRLLGADGM